MSTATPIALANPKASVPPWLFTQKSNFYQYQAAFAVFATLADAIIKCLLLLQGLKHHNRVTGLVPLMLYSFTIPFLYHFYLQRYDVFPAVLGLVALDALFATAAAGVAGLALLLLLPPAIALGRRVYST